MSNFAALGMLVALFIANVFLIVVLDRWLDALAETIVTGVVRASEFRWPTADVSFR